MNQSPKTATTQGFSRRWHIPPPLLHGREPLEGAVVLEETPGTLGLLLWEALRDVLVWVEAEPQARRGLFASGAARRRADMLAATAVPETLHSPLQVLAELLRAPETADPTGIAEACRAVARWAEGAGALGTALAFAQDRALVIPSSPGSALAVARVAHRLGDHARAEMWYRRATGLARRARAWRVYTRSFSGLGTLNRERGNLPAAQRYHLRALRGARRGGLSEERAVALHDLFGVEVESGRLLEARRYAREALDAYPRRSPRLAAFAHDVAYFWMEQGEFARAAIVFQAVLPLVRHGEERVWVQADLMRAAAGAGDEALALEMAEQVHAACRRTELSAAAARALLEVARGELQLHRWDPAEQTAATALAHARAHREGRIALAAEGLLDAIRAARAAGSGAAMASADSLAAGAGAIAPEADDSFAEGLVRSLEEFSALAGEEKRTEYSRGVW